MVRITRAGDSSFKVGQEVTLKDFLDMVKGVVENGGEMPIAVLVYK